jgi:hypothetical protein
MLAAPERARGQKRSKSTPITPAETVEVDLSRKAKRKGKTPIEQTAAGYDAPPAAEQQPDPEVEIATLNIRRARDWCRRRFYRNLPGQLIALQNLDKLGVAEQAARHVAMLAEALYAATDQEYRVHRCPRNGPKCALCRSEAYDDPDFGVPREDTPSAIEEYAMQAHDATEWRQRILSMTGVRIGEDLDHNEVWQLLNQIDYALSCYADAGGTL